MEKERGTWKDRRWRIYDCGWNWMGFFGSFQLDMFVL
jgi:hypothetical protein